MSDYLALIYSDGSMGIFSKETTLNDALEEAIASDRGETDSSHFSKLARVDVTVIEIIDTPSIAQKLCPTCGAAQSDTQRGR